MIKLNLLPQYIIELRRIRVIAVLFVVLLVIECAVVFKAYVDLQAQTRWFKYTQYFTDRQATIAKAKAAADDLDGKSQKYDPYIKFFTRGAVVDYNKQIVDALQEAGSKVGGDKNAWFSDFQISSKGNITYNGNITGLMNFLEFYFRMEDNGLQITPKAKPATQAGMSVMNQPIPLTVTGALKNALPSPPTPPEAAKSWLNLFVPYAATKTAAAAPGAAPAAGGKSGGSGGK